MTGPEIDTLLAQMCVAWPNHKLTVDQARLWRTKLTPLNTDAAFAAAGVLLNRSAFWPHWSEFQPHYREALRRVDLDQRALPEPAGRFDRETAREQIAIMRTHLGRSKERRS